jgi:hypothetical protein
LANDIGRQSSGARQFTFLLASARRDGNTELLTRKAAESLPPDYGQHWLRLMDLPLPPFEDIRHSVGVYPQPEGNERVLFDATLAATDLVFAVPLYWYSVPTAAKLYLDYWSGWLRVPDADFKARMVGRVRTERRGPAARRPARRHPQLDRRLPQDGVRRRVARLRQQTRRHRDRQSGVRARRDVLRAISRGRRLAL